MDEFEREKYYLMAKSLINEQSKPNQLSQIANIELMKYCLSNKMVEISIIKEKILKVQLHKEKSTLEDIDDLPVEAFYCLVLKLKEIDEKELVNVIALDALNLIGDMRSIRKNYFQSCI